MPVRTSMNLERLSGLMIAVAMALGLAAKNSSLVASYDFVHHATVHVGVGSWVSDQPLIFWINEGLMVFFFLLIGLELKRELVNGHLSTLKQAMLPACAAVGGMAVPALIYVALNWSDQSLMRGWAIPTATDIVLALSVLMLLGRRVPLALKAFLMALAIFDDIGAVLIIGLFYGDGLNGLPVVGAALALGLLGFLNKYVITRVWPYALSGGLLWLSMLGAGFEAALAGVLIGFAVPMEDRANPGKSPLQTVEKTLHPWVAVVVVPSFAFFNSGVVVDADALAAMGSSVSLGIILGLFLGKQLGIIGATWGAVRLFGARLPRGVTWRQIYGVAVLAGIGFTMSLFVATSAFNDPTAVANAKLAVLLASGLAAVFGILILFSATKRLQDDARPEDRTGRGIG